ncbi:MAG: hypothetical protein ACFFB3_03880 [Candidatus Hodarchaeota archaeon]
MHANEAHDFRTGVSPVTMQTLFCSFFDKWSQNPVENQYSFDATSWHDPVFDDHP